jgi:hypothetical protein
MEEIWTEINDLVAGQCGGDIARLIEQRDDDLAMPQRVRPFLAHPFRGGGGGRLDHRYDLRGIDGAADLLVPLRPAIDVSPVNPGADPRSANFILLGYRRGTQSHCNTALADRSIKRNKNWRDTASYGLNKCSEAISKTE